jgi:hypothetical protein
MHNALRTKLHLYLTGWQFRESNQSTKFAMNLARALADKDQYSC